MSEQQTRPNATCNATEIRQQIPCPLSPPPKTPPHPNHLPTITQTTPISPTHLPIIIPQPSDHHHPSHPPDNPTPPTHSRAQPTYNRNIRRPTARVKILKPCDAAQHWPQIFAKMRRMSPFWLQEPTKSASAARSEIGWGGYLERREHPAGRKSS